MNWSISKKITVACVVTLAMLAFVGLTALRQAHQSRDIASWVSHSHEVLKSLVSCRSLADQCEDECRSYAASRDNRFLSEYRSHSTELSATCSELLGKTADNAVQQMHGKKIQDFAKSAIRIWDASTTGSGIATGASALTLVRELEDEVSVSEAEEKQLLALRSQRFLDATNSILFSQGILLALSLALLLVAYFIVRRYLDEERRSQELLKSSKLQFTGIFNQAFQQMWVLSKEGNLLQANQTALDFVGLTRETEVGRPFWETAWWPNQNEAQERFKNALEAASLGDIQRFELKATEANGQEVELDFSLKPLLAANKEVVLIIAEGRDITAFKAAQTNLKENQVRLEAIMESLAEGLYQIDTQGRVLFVNANGAKMLGYSSDELVGKSLHDIVHQHDENNPDKDCLLLKSITDGSNRNREEKFCRKDGTFMPVQLLSAPLNVDGQERGSVVSVYDITVRKEAQARQNMQYALTNIFSQAESLSVAAPQVLKQLCDQLGWACGSFWRVRDEIKGEADTLDLVSVWSKNGDVEQAELNFLGKSSLTKGDELPGKVWSENGPLWVGKGSQASSAMLSEAIKQDLNTMFAFPVRSDEKVLGVITLAARDAAELTSSQLQMLNGTGSQFGLFIERRTSEDRLRDREMLFLQLANNIREIFWISSAKPGQNKVLYVSPAFEEVFGRPVSEVYERANSYFDAVVPEDRDRVKHHILKEMYTGSAIEYRIRRPDGTMRWVWGRWSVVYDQDGKPERLVGIVHDISERKEMERRVSEFYSTVSHELRTPLTSIRASLGLLEGGIAGVLPDKAKKLVDIARAESDRLIRLINDILDIRKIEAGRLELKQRPVKARKVVDVTLQGTDGMAHEFGVKLVPVVETEREVFADQDRVVQVLANLVSNAIKYAPRDSDVTVKVTDHGAFCRYSVTDKGPGIPEDQLHKLFGLFQQLDSTDTRQKGGTGLGLAISKAIVEQHGGTVSVNTKVGQGSTFYFDIPANKEPVREEPVKPVTDFRAGYVLVVEDDEKLTEVLSQLLEGENYCVSIARTIAEADELVRQSPPQAVLLDVHLPDGNGLDWMRRIRETPKGRNIPVVVMTGQETDDCYSLPMLIDWLRKPVDVSHLLASLKVGLSRKPSIAGPQVLIVEDDQSTREIIVHQLNELGVRCIEAASGFMALQMVHEHNPDLIILDLGLPGFDGFELVKKLETSCSKLTPLLVYTSRDLTNADIEKLQLGLTKHLIKSKTSQEDFLNAVRDLLAHVLPPRDAIAQTTGKS
ncbi:MAG TPA: PAS domain S-box protein [Oculatellaceae cyanobacterium]